MLPETGCSKPQISLASVLFPAHDADHLALMDREIHILQRNLFRRIAEFQIRDPQKFLPVLLPADPRLLRMIPAAHLLLVFPGERQLLHMLRVQRLRDLHPRITQCRQIKRLPDSVLQKLFSRKL